MPETKTLVPKPGLLVRDPLTMEPLPAGGAPKPLTTYWLRRLKDGDVSLAPASRPAREKGD